jgi:molybdenum cofactor biosynthesis enzyme MoaA
LDSLIESKFEKLTRRPGKYLLRVLSSVYNAINIGLKTKINCVLMAGTNDDEVKDFVNLTKNSSLDVRFIEYMPFDGNKWSNDYVMGYRKVLDNLEYGHGMKLTMDKSSKRSSRQNQSVDTNTVTDVQIHRHVHRHAGDNGNFDPNDTTKWYRASTGYPADISNTTATRSASASDTQSASVPTPYEGRVGFITTMTDNFCSSCNRIRLTADGKLKVCLFGDDELNLLNLLRDGSSDSEIINEISNAIKKKEKRLGGEQDAINLVNSKNRSMIMIGG